MRTPCEIDARDSLSAWSQSKGDIRTRIPMKAPACFSRWRAGIYGAVLSFGAACTGAPSDGAATAGGPSDGAPADGGAAGQAPEGGGSIAFPTGGAGAAPRSWISMSRSPPITHKLWLRERWRNSLTQGTRAEFAAQILIAARAGGLRGAAADAPPRAYSIS
jgi:hypothetical protein